LCGGLSPPKHPVATGPYSSETYLKRKHFEFREIALSVMKSKRALARFSTNMYNNALCVTWLSACVTCWQGGWKRAFANYKAMAQRLR